MEILNHLSRSSPVPITLINTRDCFAYDLKYTETKLNLGPGRENVIKKEYYYDPQIKGGYPDNLKMVVGLPPDADMSKKENLMVGVTCYENFYTHEEMDELESEICETEQLSLRDCYLP